ncbi:nucleotidyltransferase domain-containing protein [Defluviitalea saccharophila]|uniref:Nucleotidyltransferase domain-containing protein n=1 Tax=Defluviitalea saccharophila TaxID=879970 RepID=A0ABZ2Y560_9FIRM
MYLPEEYKKIIVDFLKKEFNPKFIYLFGSFAKGEGREDSDIDLAIYTDASINSYDLLYVRIVSLLK